MQEFKRKKEYFDEQIHDLEIASDQSDKFFNTLANLQIIEKRKIEELGTLIACQEYLYNKKNTFKGAVEGLKFVIAKDIQQSKSRIEYYDRLKESNKLVSKHCANTLKNKNSIYKYMDREYHYLKKQQEIESKRKIEIERELPAHKTQKTKDILIRTENKLQTCFNNTNTSLQQFYQKYQEAQNYKYQVMNPVVSGFANFNKNYFDQMNKNYSQVNFPYTNQYNNQQDLSNSDVISNYKVNQKLNQGSQDLKQQLLQSNHSNRQDNFRGSLQSQKDSHLNQNIYMKNDQNSPKTTALKSGNTNVIQHYDPPMIYKDSNQHNNLPYKLNFNKPDTSSNQIPYMMKNSQDTALPINDLVTPYMNNQLTEDKMNNLWNSDKQNQRLQSIPNQNQFNKFNNQQNNYQNTQHNIQQNPQTTRLSFGPFQNSSQQQSQYEQQKQSEYEQNYFPFKESNHQSQNEQQNENLNVFSFKEPKLHPQRVNEALKSSDDFFYR